MKKVIPDDMHIHLQNIDHAARLYMFCNFSEDLTSPRTRSINQIVLRMATFLARRRIFETHIWEIASDDFFNQFRSEGLIVVVFNLSFFNPIAVCGDYGRCLAHAIVATFASSSFIGLPTSKNPPHS